MIKYISAFLVLILFGTVFVIEKDIPNGIIESKNYGYLFLGIPIGVCFIAVITLTKAFKISFSRIDIILALWLMWTIINLVIINKLSTSVVLDVLICSIVFALILKQFIFIGFQYKLYFSIACLVIGGGQALLGLLQLYGYQESLHTGYKMTGSFHNPGPFGVYIAGIFIFALGHYLGSNNAVLKNISGIVCLICILALPSTQSRSAWIGACGGAIYLFVIKFGVEQTRKFFAKKYFIFVLFLTITIISFLLWNFKAGSALGRMLTWRVSIEMVKEKPITGWGLGEFSNQYGFFQAKFFKNNPNNEQLIALADKNEYAFNDPLQLLIENGLIGLVLFFILIFFVLCSKSQNVSTYLIAARAGVITILLAGLFSYPFEMISIWWLFLFFIAFVSVEIDNLFIKTFLFFPKIFVGVVFSLLSFLAINHEISVYKAKQTWQQANEAFQQQLFDAAKKHYREVNQKLPGERKVLLGLGKVLYMTGKIEESAEVLEKASQTIADPFLFTNLGDSYQTLKKFDQAEKAYQNAADMIPNRIYPKYLLAKMFLQKQDTLMAQKTAQEILKMRIKVNSQATLQIKEEMKKILE